MEWEVNAKIAIVAPWAVDPSLAWRSPRDLAHYLASITTRNGQMHPQAGERRGRARPGDRSLLAHWLSDLLAMVTDLVED